MKKQLFKLLAFAGIGLAAMVSSCKKDSNNQMKSSNPASVNTETTTAPRAVTWQLVWADEFNGTSVDGSKW
ncbi:MAG: glycoside hydrolase, partial [Bacteroidota bacterium]